MVIYIWNDLSPSFNNVKFNCISEASQTLLKKFQSVILPYNVPLVMFN